MKERRKKHHRKDRLTKDHIIPQCFGKIIPSQDLKRAIESPNNIRLVSRSLHDEIDKPIGEYYELLKEGFRGKRIKEYVIYKNTP